MSFTFTDQRSGAIHESLDFLKPGVSAWSNKRWELWHQKWGYKNGIKSN
jgi:hypothetical protein